MPAHPTTVDFYAEDDIPVRIVRSTKRRKTVSSQWKDDRFVVSVPAALTESAERTFVEEMLKKFRQRKRTTDWALSDEALMQRAIALDRHYTGGLAAPVSVRWVSNQTKRWGSATVYERRIRLSTRLQYMPQWVQDYVLLHELCHLVEPADGHGPRFNGLLNRFERRREADEYLKAFSAGYRAHAREMGRPDDQLEDLDEGGDVEHG
ncbi:M48 family metallopeptidase [Glutamicibacter sp. V16R2B1]|uniref:M48 family metallopeptidase n=1 Tax=Glutamicibacter sp. V16R2B1 TaxID=2036207 RepID=UPI0010FF4678|nr:M48 family metallopeptidase [Glutamicibacter sp. V16R2B1]TLK51186.1 M48 family metallopeptidase [Glutamicibacter sp. V16R2B1]